MSNSAPNLPGDRKSERDGKMGTENNPETIVPDTIVPDGTNTIVPDGPSQPNTIVPDTLKSHTIVPDGTNTIVPDGPDTIVPDGTGN
jgi:hypothetical protein